MRFRVLVFLAVCLGALSGSVHAEQEHIYAQWREPDNLRAWNMDVRMKILNTSNSTFFAQTFDLNNGGGGYVGFQQLGDGNRTMIFSMWKSGLHGNRYVRAWGASSNCRQDPGNENDGGMQCFKAYHWKTHRWYRLRIWRLNSNTWSDTWGAWVIDSWGNETKIGEITVANNWLGEYTTVADTSTFLENFSSQAVCEDPPYTRLRMQAPSFNLDQSYAPYQSNSGGSDCTDKGGVYFTNRGLDLNMYMY